MKLSEAQIRALKALPFKVVIWGGKPFSSMPSGVRHQTLEALRAKKLCTCVHNGLQEHWQPTDAGRRALAEAEGK